MIPTVTRKQMVEVDRLMGGEIGISLTQMMENAGLQLARLAIDRYRPSSVLVLVGSGGDGGGRPGSRPAAFRVGRRCVADISVPGQLYARLGIDVPLDLFLAGQIQPVTRDQGK